MNKPKMQGTAFESWLVKRLATVPNVGMVRRLAEGGMNDPGDVGFDDAAGNSWYVECKATQTLNVTRVLAKARTKAPEAMMTVLAWKRLVKLKDGQKNRRPDGEPIVISMGLDTFEHLLSRLR